MPARLSVTELWESVGPSRGNFDPEDFADLPEPARRYLQHAIAPGTQRATAVRLRMKGELKLKRWHRFAAEEVIHQHRGMIWSAQVRASMVPIRGYDRYIDGRGSMRWKLLGAIPVVRASGDDVTRSAAGRFASELIWLPSALAASGVSWSGEGADEASARVSVGGETVSLHLHLDQRGPLQRIQLSRWGNPGGTPHRYVSFGGIVEEERSFAGYTIPVQMRAGWYFGGDRFDAEGEFFRVTIQSAEYR